MKEFILFFGMFCFVLFCFFSTENYQTILFVSDFDKVILKWGGGTLWGALTFFLDDVCQAGFKM